MKRNKKSTENLRASMLESCGEIHEDDGVDPRTYFQPRRNQKENRKTKQLCQQIARTINLCLNDCDNPIVQAMFLVGVQPAPDSSCLLLHIEVDIDDFDCDAALDAVRQQVPRLQFEIARSINRKRVPNLVFSVASAGGSIE